MYGKNQRLTQLSSILLALLGCLALPACGPSEDNPTPTPLEVVAMEVNSRNFADQCETGTEDFTFEPYVTFNALGEWNYFCRQVLNNPLDFGSIVNYEFPIISVDPVACTYHYATVGGLSDSSGVLSYCPREEIDAVLGEMPTARSP
jgi:hypothetical protein